MVVMLLGPGVVLLFAKQCIGLLFSVDSHRRSKLDQSGLVRVRFLDAVGRLFQNGQTFLPGRFNFLFAQLVAAALMQSPFQAQFSVAYMAVNFEIALSCTVL